MAGVRSAGHGGDAERSAGEPSAAGTDTEGLQAEDGGRC